MNALQKYINFSKIGFVVWSGGKPTLSHVQMAARNADAGYPVSAGFVSFLNGKPHCAGESLTLGLEAHSDDSELLAKQFGLV